MQLLCKTYTLHHFGISLFNTAHITTETVFVEFFLSIHIPETACIRDDVPEAAAPKAATTYTANFTQKADDAKADAEAMHKAGVKAADNPNYYDDIFNIFKNK